MLTPPARSVQLQTRPVDYQAVVSSAHGDVNRVLGLGRVRLLRGKVLCTTRKLKFRLNQLMQHTPARMLMWGPGGAPFLVFANLPEISCL